MARGKGRAPDPKAAKFKEAPTKPHDQEQHIHLSLRHERAGYQVEDLSERQRSEFVLKWAKRCRFTWKEIGQQSKHGLGYEMLPASAIKRSVPSDLEQEKYMVFRHDGNLPVVGFKAGSVFYPLWFESNYGDVYDH